MYLRRYSIYCIPPWLLTFDFFYVFQNLAEATHHMAKNSKTRLHTGVLPYSTTPPPGWLPDARCFCFRFRAGRICTQLQPPSAARPAVQTILPLFVEASPLAQRQIVWPSRKASRLTTSQRHIASHHITKPYHKISQRHINTKAHHTYLPRACAPDKATISLSSKPMR